MEKIILPKQTNKVIMEMLMKANYFLENAKKNSFSNNEFDRAIAIQNLDNSIEYILRIIIKHLDIENIKNITINTCELTGLLGEINKFLKEYGDDGNIIKLIPYRVEIETIRKMRNLVQHGVTWSCNEIGKYINDGEKFFEKVLIIIFGIERNEISYSSIIKNEIIKKNLLEAEDKIKNKKYLEAIVACRNAFEYANFIYNDYSSIRINRAPALAELKNNTEFVYYYLKALDEKCNVGLLGIDITKYERFKEYISYIPFEYLADKRVGYKVLRRELELEDAKFCYSFVTESVLKLELNQYEEINKIEKNQNDEEIAYIEKMSVVIIKEGAHTFLAKFKLNYFT